MQSEILLTAGPTQIPQRVLDAMNVPALHHRTDKFKSIFHETLAAYEKFIGASHSSILLSASGTGAMEAVLLNSCVPGNKILVLDGGKFGERWRDIGDRLGLIVESLVVEWGTTATVAELRDFILRHQDAKVLCVQYSETSTTTLHPVPMIGDLLNQTAPAMLYCVDAISTLGTISIDLLRDHIDILIAGSQKGLMLPPGLSMLSLSARAWERVEQTPRRTLYFDLLTERKAHAEASTAWTPCTHLILGLRESLKMINEEGPAEVFARHRRMSQLARDGLTALGFKLITTAECASPGVTGAFPPTGVEANELRRRVLERDGFRITGGQGKWKNSSIRLGHMGCISDAIVSRALESIRSSL